MPRSYWTGGGGSGTGGVGRDVSASVWKGILGALKRLEHRCVGGMAWHVRESALGTRSAAGVERPFLCFSMLVGLN